MLKMCHMDNIRLKSNSNFICETCQMAKFHRLPFTQSDSIASLPFELVHMDLWGPYKTLDITGASYFLTVVDDHTRFTWVYLIQNKMQVRNCVKNFFAYVQTIGEIVDPLRTRS